ncbi:hypothetical protein JCM33374_g4777 [Metschnikowia sp. JCM 33374]|nr:hypothetical protein JCM33374_g4777 [Metschnikowia sp. JCM 33374]
MPQATKTATEQAAAAVPSTTNTPAAAAKASKDVGSASPASASAPAAAPVQQTTELSIESIGWLFLQKYYGSYTADLSKLYGFYDAQAAISHENFPSESTHDNDTEDAGKHNTKTVHVAHGSEAVRAFYEGHAAAASSSAAKNKIVVENATFQKSVADSILIVVSGSWKRGSSHLWQFVQTFVLRAKGKTVYDIANDVLKFIDLAEEYKETSIKVNVVEEKPAPKAEASAAPSNGEKPSENVELSAENPEKSESVPDAAPEVAAEPKPVVPEAAPKATEEPEAIVDAEPSKEEIVVVPEANEEAQAPKTDAASTETEETPAASESEKSSEQEKPAAPAAPAAPAVKPTWANLAAIGPKTAPKNGAVAAPIATKVAASPAAVPALVTKKAPSPAQPAPQATANGKYKKEEWYPIYIKNVDVEEEELKAALVKQFGEIKFFKKTNKTALCDFRSKEDQQRALETREMVIKTNVILLEPRIHKTFNNAKPDAKKDKKHLKKNGFKKN